MECYMYFTSPTMVNGSHEDCYFLIKFSYTIIIFSPVTVRKGKSFGVGLCALKLMPKKIFENV